MEGLPAVSPWRGGGSVGQAVLPHQDQHYRIINEMRAARVLELPLDYIPSEEFLRIRSERRSTNSWADAVARDVREEGAAAQRVAPLPGQPVQVPLLSREQEVHLFRKMNYLKHKARGSGRSWTCRGQEQPDGAGGKDVRRIGGDQEPDHPREPAAGGFDRQAARGTGGELL